MNSSQRVFFFFYDRIFLYATKLFRKIHPEESKKNMPTRRKSIDLSNVSPVKTPPTGKSTVAREASSGNNT